MKFLTSVLLFGLIFACMGQELDLLTDNKPPILDMKLKRKYLAFRPQEAFRDCSGFDTLKLSFRASRAGDKFIILLVSNPEGSKTFNYYFKLVEITKPGNSELAIPFKTFTKNRKPVGFEKIDSVDISFEGWGLKPNPDLQFELLSLKLENNAEKERRIRESEVAKFMAPLPSKAWSIVPNHADRKFWKRFADTPYAKDLYKRAEAFTKTGKELLPPDEYYLDFSRKEGAFAGNRRRYEEAVEHITKGVELLTLAYCLTQDPQYLPRLEEYITAWCDGLKTWVLPAHDSGLTNFHRTKITIDLASASSAAFATQLRLVLKGVLSPESDAKLSREIRRQVIDPLDAALAAGTISKIAWWYGKDSNWTAVCHSCLLMTLLGNEQPAARRGELIYDVFQKGESYLTGFSSDGYCSEGPAYWSYGFGCYLNSAAVLFMASNGKINLTDNPAVRMPADYPERMMLTANLMPSLADSLPNGRVDWLNCAIRDWLMNRKSESWKTVAPRPFMSGCSQMIQMRIFSPVPEPAKQTLVLEPLTKFSDAKLYIVRPGSRPGVRMSALFKGGHNDEMHNHNDTGSFIIAVDDTMLLIDPGSTVYSRDTFNHNRYKNRILNSFCHNVPMLDGRLQSSGKNTEAILLNTTESADHFEVSFDLRKAYPSVKGLLKFERIMRYDRQGSGSVTITDTVKYDSPRKFESALNTFGTWRQIGEKQLEIADGKAKVLIDIDTDGKAFRVYETSVTENISCKKTVRRLGIELLDPVGNATVKLRISAL